MVSIHEDCVLTDGSGFPVEDKGDNELNKKIICRFCGTELHRVLLDLGMSPLCESYVPAGQLNHMEPFYPLKVFVCDNCFLVQVGEYVSPEDIFSEYAYFSSFSDSWLRHSEKYAHGMIKRFGLSSGSSVVEVGSNDGYLLQYFARNRIPVRGIDPAGNVVKVAEQKGVPTVNGFFGVELAEDLTKHGLKADLLIGNNVLAQVPDINDFIEGMRLLLAPRGVLTMEFPHLLKLIEGNQFDTIYHEHFS
jgi:SAM-dependent methyltransferase